MPIDSNQTPSPVLGCRAPAIRTPSPDGRDPPRSSPYHHICRFHRVRQAVFIDTSGTPDPDPDIEPQKKAPDALAPSEPSFPQSLPPSKPALESRWAGTCHSRGGGNPLLRFSKGCTPGFWITQSLAYVILNVAQRSEVCPEARRESHLCAAEILRFAQSMS